MDQPNSQSYGVPLYGASWAPLNVARSAVSDAGDGEVEGSSSSTSSVHLNHLVIAGGGGEGRSGISNEILLADFDFAKNSLPKNPVARLKTGAELPYRMAVHPSGEGLICSFPKSCRWFEWARGNENGILGLQPSERVLTELKDVGQQLSLAFSEDGSLLAAGGEDGKLRVFKWPTLQILLNEEDAYTAVKDLHFSVDGKYLVSVGRGGPCRVWDVTNASVVASLPKENDEVFGFCRFSQNISGDQVLYTTAMQSKGGNIISWNTSSWKRIASKQIVRDPVSAFNVSADGKLLAIGTIEGNILIIDSSKMRVQMVVKKAHMGLVTALTFTSDSRALGSASMDSSARVTLVQDKKANGFNYWIIVLIILVAVAFYLLKNARMIPEGFQFLQKIAP